MNNFLAQKDPPYGLHYPAMHKKEPQSAAEKSYRVTIDYKVVYKRSKNNGQDTACIIFSNKKQVIIITLLEAGIT